MSTYSNCVPIAVVGMACRLPGAEDVKQFWNMLVEGRNAIAPVPNERFNREFYYDPRRGVIGKSYSDRAALVDYSTADVPDDLFSASELSRCDVAHATLCRVAARAVDDARLSRESLGNAPAGVYIGHASASGRAGDYAYGVHIAQTAEYLREVEEFDKLAPAIRESAIRELVGTIRRQMPWRTAECNPRLEAHEAADLIGRKLGLNGPQIVFNSACASSLHALARGVQALALGRVETAIVGGASCFHSGTLVLFSHAQSLSADGSYPFTEGADGLIVGEGYVVFILKRLETAVADGNRILAVLPGIGISSDGHGKSLWAPRSEGQVEAIRRAYAQGLDIARLQYIEAHATSTNLGDVTEIEAISKVLNEHLPAGTRIPIGGVKRNIGHTLEVAGVAGLLKVVLAMQHETIPPAVDGTRELNKGVDWNNVPLQVNDRPIAWPAANDGGPRRAAVNAFGIGGLNLHVVVDDYGPSHSTVFGGVSLTSLSQHQSRVNSSDRAVAIIGVGLVLPGAKNVDEFRELLQSGRRAIGPIPTARWNVPLFSNSQLQGDRTIPMPAAGVITDFEYDWRKHRIPPKQLAQASPLQFMILDAVDQAFQQAGYGDEKEFDRKRTGCIVGTAFGGDFSTQLLMGMLLPETQKTASQILQRHGVDAETAKRLIEGFRKKVLDHFPALIDETGSFTSSALASRITKSFNLMGGGVAVDAGDGSAFAALDGSVDMLQTGACNMMVCVTGQQDLTPEAFHISNLHSLLAPAADCPSPFDIHSNGTLPGEGCVALLLKRHRDAVRDGDNVLGVICGIGAASNQDHELSVRCAVQQALSDAGITASDVRGVESIGSGIARIDRAELSALAAEYSDSASRDGKLPLSTPVGQIGNLASASGLVSLVAALLALDQEALPPTGAFSKPADYLQAMKISLSTEPQPLSTFNPEGKLFLGLSGCSITGSSYHVVLQRGEPVKPQQVPQRPSTTGSWQAESLASGVIHFDATIRRRERMRLAAESGHRNGGNGKSGQPSPPATAVQAEGATLKPAESAPITPDRVAGLSAQQQDAPSPPSSLNLLDPSEVETHVIQLVMERTGYPQEIIDLDAELEADLGIDDIKKAELFAELGQFYQVRAFSGPTLDHFPNFRSAVDYLVKNASTSAPASAPFVAAPAATATSVPIVEPTSSSIALDPAELETFLINFVVEQTGYPEEIVDMDADLEADLGIDSIKKAQLFGELGEYFDVQASTELTLDDFPTLGTVMQYLLDNTTAGETSSTPVAAPTSAPVAVPPPAPIGNPEPVAETAPSSGMLDPAELEMFLINFVIEQTGYPKEIVDMDADLEADLGIDSIKKAQLFGELGEYFDVQASAELTLDDFPTLRTVMQYLLENSVAD